MTGAPLAVFDTNILVSGLLNPFGPPGRILDLLLSRQARLAYDDRMLVEYRDVLYRAEFHFSRVLLDRFFAIFAYQEYITPAPWPFAPSPDPDDTLFLEVAAAASKVLVTGNLRHFPKSCRGNVQVYSPSQWLIFIATL